MKRIISMVITVTVLFTGLCAFSGCTRKRNKVNILTDENKSNSAEKQLVNIAGENQQNGKVDIKSKDSYYFVLNGKKYTTENKIKDIQNSGVVQDTKSTQAEIQKNTFYIGGAYFRAESNSRTVFSVVPVNNSEDSVECAEASIGGFNVENYYYKDYDGKIEVAGGISIGSSVDDLLNAYGDPTEKDMRADYDNLGILYRYKVGLYQYFEFEIDKKEQKVIQITWRYFEGY